MSFNSVVNARRISKASRNRGFSVVELLSVCACVALLLLVSVPGMANACSGSELVGCINNQQILTRACVAYAQDHNDNWPVNYNDVPAGRTNVWATGYLSFTTEPGVTNTANLKNLEISRYLPSVDVYKCPADKVLSDGQRKRGYLARARSYSMNGYVGYPNEPIFGRGAKVFRKLSDLTDAPPSNIFAILDEHPDSINDSTFWVEYPTTYRWIDWPASYHGGGLNVSFTDGHVETRILQPNNRAPVTFFSTFPPNTRAGDVDVVWFTERATRPVD